MDTPVRRHRSSVAAEISDATLRRHHETGLNSRFWVDLLRDHMETTERALHRQSLRRLMSTRGLHLNAVANLRTNCARTRL